MQAEAVGAGQGGAEGFDGFLPFLHGLVRGAQAGCVDGVEVAAAEAREVEGVAVFTEFDAVASGWFDVAGFLVWCLRFGSDFLYARESAPGFACGQIQDEDAAGVGIGHIGEFSLCVDAYVVEVAVGQDGWCFQGVDFVNFVAPEVDAV